MKYKTDESGEVIIEAAFVFPIMFFAILMMLYLGNAYYQQAKLNVIVDIAAVKGAAYCADPMLDDIEENGGVPDRYNNIQPYRYLFSMSEVETKIRDYVSKQYAKAGDGFFGSMAPAAVTCDAKFNNSILMYSFTVEASYRITVPFRFMGTEPPIVLSLDAKATAPVSDNGEFINNLDMAIDYYYSTGLAQKVSAATSKISEFFSRFGKD